MDVKNLNIQKAKKLNAAFDTVYKEFPLGLSPMQNAQKWIKRKENVDNQHIYDVENYILRALKYSTEALDFEQICDILNLCDIKENKSELNNAMRNLFIHGYIKRQNEESIIFFDPESKYIISK